VRRGKVDVAYSVRVPSTAFSSGAAAIDVASYGVDMGEGPFTLRSLFAAGVTYVEVRQGDTSAAPSITGQCPPASDPDVDLPARWNGRLYVYQSITTAGDVFLQIERTEDTVRGMLRRLQGAPARRAGCR
jgi:hypothetical protein